MDPLMTANDVSRILNVSTRTVRRLAEARAIPGARKIGSVWRFDPKKFLDWLADLKKPEPRHEPVQTIEKVKDLEIVSHPQAKQEHVSKNLET